MARIGNKLWRYSVATIFFSLLLVGCQSKSLDPQAVDKATIEYIHGELINDLPLFDNTIDSVVRIKPTRQDNIPVALVYATYKDGSTNCDFIYFTYESINKVFEVIKEQPNISTEELAAQTNLSEIEVLTIQKIICIATGNK